MPVNKLHTPRVDDGERLLHFVRNVDGLSVALRNAPVLEAALPFGASNAPQPRHTPVIEAQLREHRHSEVRNEGKFRIRLYRDQYTLVKHNPSLRSPIDIRSCCVFSSCPEVPRQCSAGGTVQAVVRNRSEPPGHLL